MFLQAHDVHGLTSRTLRIALAMSVATASLIGLAACAPTRSVQAYCAAVDQHKKRYLSAMSDASSSGAISGLIESAAAMGDLQTMWADLAKVAPDDIQTDTETVRDSWAKAQDKAADRNVLGALTAAITSAPAMSRVNAYIAKHCGVDAAPVGTGLVAVPSASPTPTTDAAAETRQVVTQPQDDDGQEDHGPAAVINADDDNNQTGAISAQLWAVSDGKIVRSDASIPVDSGTDRTTWAVGAQQDSAQPPSFVAVQTLHTPSAGLTPEKWVTHVIPLDSSGTASGSDVTFAGCKTDDCSISTVTRVDDVAVIAWSLGLGQDHVSAVDTQSGQTIWTRDGEQLSGIDGSTAILDHVDDLGTGSDGVSAVDALTGTTAWTFKGSLGIDGGYSQTFGDHLGLVVAASAADQYDGLRRLNVVDLRSGAVLLQRWSDGHGQVAYDPSTKRFIFSATAGSVREGAKSAWDLVVLSTTGDTVFGVDAARFEELGDPSVEGALDGRAWIDGQNGIDIIDTATGAEDPAAPPSDQQSAAGLIPVRFEQDATSVGGAVVLDVDGTPSFETMLTLSTDS